MSPLNHTSLSVYIWICEIMQCKNMFNYGLKETLNTVHIRNEYTGRISAIG